MLLRGVAGLGSRVVGAAGHQSKDGKQCVREESSSIHNNHVFIPPFLLILFLLYQTVFGV